LLPTVVQIDRKQSLSPEVFARDYLQGAGTPVIVTDATERWAARSKWTFEFMKTAYGADLVCPERAPDDRVGKMTKLATYIDYLDAPAEDLDGFWVDPAKGQPLRTPPDARGSLLYLVDWRAFHKHPELYDDIEPAPYFVNDWVFALNPTLRDVFERAAQRVFWEVLVGPAESLSEFHQDHHHTHAYLAQIQGRKQAFLFSPDDLDRTTSYEGVLEAGDVLFIPADWWHRVRGLEKSITVSHNFFNAANFSAHLGGLLRRLPELVGG
jgi:hypothetical protein